MFISNPENSFPFLFFKFYPVLWIIIILKSDDSDRTETLWIDGPYTFGIYQREKKKKNNILELRENQTTNFLVINGCEAHGDLSFPTHTRTAANLWLFFSKIIIIIKKSLGTICVSLNFFVFPPSHVKGYKLIDKNPHFSRPPVLFLISLNYSLVTLLYSLVKNTVEEEE